ncbi:hypothetical protein [Pseudomonas sp. PDM13]|uniref:hypothetical protein n=1 Tax=Pseudomonas sp. PDM13 TaxID=2769255 RepID=UPI0021DFACF1|nr:hypothetical protein [Pseudomonas sp. PDM13]MCU9951555.1 hypothetical protein [Pseudomonas sp. PDM13]
MQKQTNTIVTLSVLFALGLAIPAGALIIYWRYFGDFSVTADGEKWGQFGDFMGGTANPLLSFLTFSALLLTIFLQNKQLATSNSELENSRQELILTREELAKTAEAATRQTEHLERESRLSELLILIDKLATRTNRNFNDDILDGKLSLHRVLSQHLLRIQMPETAALIEHYNQESSRTYRVITWVASDLERLSELIIKYNKTKENYTSPLPDFYRKEFGELVNMLHEHNMINKEVYAFFCHNEELDKDDRQKY